MRTRILFIAYFFLVFSFTYVHAGVKLVQYSTNVEVYKKPCPTSKINLSVDVQPYFTTSQIILKFTKKPAKVTVGVNCGSTANDAYFLEIDAELLPLNKYLKFTFTCIDGVLVEAVTIWEVTCSNPAGSIFAILNLIDCPKPCKFDGTIVFTGFNPILKDLDQSFRSNFAIPNEVFAEKNLDANPSRLTRPAFLVDLAGLDVAGSKALILKSYKQMLAKASSQSDSVDLSADYFIALNKAYSHSNLNLNQVFTTELRSSLFKEYSLLKKN